jgi:electron transfer flavoprotein alpha subunit
LNDATARALTAALELGQPVDVLVAGQNLGAAAAAAAKLERVAKVLVADDSLYTHGLAEPLAALIVKLANGYDAIVAPSTASAKNVAPRAVASFNWPPATSARRSVAIVRSLRLRHAAWRPARPPI